METLHVARMRTRYRLPAGGGRIQPGAMPALHRWWGNPMFTVLSRCVVAMVLSPLPLTGNAPVSQSS
mgnify:CR=1 FL=1